MLNLDFYFKAGWRDLKKDPALFNEAEITAPSVFYVYQEIPSHLPLYLSSYTPLACGSQDSLLLSVPRLRTLIGAVKKNLMWVTVFPVFSLHELQNKKSIADKATLLTAIHKWFV